MENLINFLISALPILAVSEQSMILLFIWKTLLGTLVKPVVSQRTPDMVRACRISRAILMNPTPFKFFLFLWLKKNRSPSMILLNWWIENTWSNSRWWDYVKRTFMKAFNKIIGHNCVNSKHKFSSRQRDFNWCQGFLTPVSKKVLMYIHQHFLWVWQKVSVTFAVSKFLFNFLFIFYIN